MATYKYLTANLKLDADSLFLENFKLPFFAISAKKNEKKSMKENKLKNIQLKEKN